jgi:hypothetical protein
LTQISGSLTPGGLNNPFVSNFRYSAFGGAVTMPDQVLTHSDPTVVQRTLADLNGDLGNLLDPIDFPDIVPLPTLIPTVWNPVIELTIAGPGDWWSSFSSSPLPPPLTGATEATIKLNLDIFVPFVGFQRRTATFNLTRLSAVPEPSAWSMAVAALAIWPVLRDTGTWQGRAADC